MPQRKSQPEGAFVTWEVGDEKGRKVAIEVASRAYGAAGVYRNIAPSNTSVRDGFDRRDYDYFRPGESVPTKDKDIIAACMQSYERIGIVRNVIDLMADFTCKGIDVVHPAPKVDAIFKDWFKRVKGPERTERMANMLYRAASVIVRRGTAELPDTTMDVLRTEGADHKIGPTVTIPGGEIPWSYTVLDPRTVEVLGGELAPLLGQDAFTYAIKIPEVLARRIKNPKTPTDKEIVSRLPVNIVNSAKGTRLVVLDKEKVAAMYYKRDDYEVWPRPFVYPLLDSFSLLKKMQQADRSALDGAIQHIRLWRLGDIENRIFPTAAHIAHLSEVLLNNVGGGTMDLVWGPDLDFKESSTDVHHFLGQEKYAQVMNEIYGGMGIPPTMTGTTGGSSGGFTNNFVSLKTLTERLEYGRLIITMFWEQEFALVQKAFGFRQPAQLVFDHPVLSDDTTEKKLLIDLADRNIISIEYLQERFGAIPEIEAVRLRRENRAREAGTMPKKAGPFHLESQQKESLERLFAQTGAVTPDEVGLDLRERKPGAKSPAEVLSKLKIQENAAKPTPKPAGGGAKKPKKSTNGRPAGSKDQRGRKKKVVKPRTKATTAYTQAFLWVDEAQRAVAEITQPVFLKVRKKKNLRALSSKEADDYEKFKFAVLCQFRLEDKVTEDTVKAVLAKPLAIPSPVASLYRATTEKYMKQEGKEPTVEKARQIQAAVMALYLAEFPETV
jgi:hypothetical protein